MNLYQKLEWLLRMGVTETVSEAPVCRVRSGASSASDAVTKASVSAQENVPVSALPPRAHETGQRTHAEQEPLVLYQTEHTPTDNLVQSAVQAANGADSLVALYQALNAFDACPLKKTANSTVFAKGNPDADVMVICDVPGAAEDKQGLPYAGENGEMLDRMLAAIGLNLNHNAYVGTLIPWRPPGNRKPTPAETAMCLPFLKKHIELVHPKVLLLFGGLTSGALLGIDSISKARGTWQTYQSENLPAPIDCIVTFGPDFLMKNPSHRKYTWEDLKRLKAKLENPA